MEADRTELIVAATVWPGGRWQRVGGGMRRGVIGHKRRRMVGGVELQAKENVRGWGASRESGTPEGMIVCGKREWDDLRVIGERD
jgi:hypothetical protein